MDGFKNSTKTQYGDACGYAKGGAVQKKSLGGLLTAAVSPLAAIVGGGKADKATSPIARW
jgi:hypothetical protein